MKKNILVMAFGMAAMLMTACGGGTTKSVADNSYYNNPRGNEPVVQQQAPVKQPKETKRSVREVDKLAAAETNSMRAVGIGNDYEEKDARREAINDARNTLAGFIEASVVALTKEYHKKTQKQQKKTSESSIEGTVEYAVGQTISTKMIGIPEAYDLSDGTIRVYVCLELTKPNKQVLSEIYDNLKDEDILGVDYDKEKFIQDNMDRIKELRAKAENK